MTQRQRRAAIIGAGLCGLTCARELTRAGWSVEVFEKSRGTGGRLSAKRLDEIGTVDLGAQFITAATPAFAELVATAARIGTLAQWRARIAYLAPGTQDDAKEQTRWVGVPSMNAWLSEVWPRASIHFERRIESLRRRSDGQWVLNERQAQTYDAVVLAMPPAQGAELARGTSVEACLREIPMSPCWAGLALFDTPLPVAFDAAFIRGSGLDWIANNHSKPGRTEHPAAWTLHASGDLSTALLDAPKEQVAAQLLAELAVATSAPLPTGRIVVTHLWRYAAPLPGAAPGVVWDKRLGLGAGGDWSIGGRVEGAFIAGKSLAAAIVS